MIHSLRHFILYALVVVGLAALSVAQPADSKPKFLTCPGDPPGNLASLDCNFTPKMRLDAFVSSSVTDQAAIGALFFGSLAQFQNSPSEWGRGWSGFGKRAGSRYAQNMTKGLAEFTVGTVLGTDPRPVSYSSDPLISNYRPGLSPRIGHAFVDFLTTRISKGDGKGSRLPNLPLFAGAAASAFVGNTWYPQTQTTAKEVGIRAASSLGTALAGRFYNEFKPEVNRLLAVIFRKRG